jgi:serine/threonine protein kinase/tetratricopeptide (TPR) repeat protein
VHHPVEAMNGSGSKFSTAHKVCPKCGASIFADAPQGACSACLLETGLGFFLDENSDAHSSRLLTDFGDYELLEEMGRGAQGVVYRARQKSLNRTVALKVIALGQWAAQPHLKRFRLEAEAAASLDHPLIVPIYEIGERDGSCYFSMKFVEGGQLDQVVRQKPLPIRGAVELVVKLAHTVHYAHEHGILHRDIKPGNVLLDENGEPHLTDFGLARLVEAESTVTRTMEVLGTPSYMAPEQARGETARLTSATDVYGLGGVFYQLLTCNPPFAGGTTYETTRLVLETEPRHPRLWNAKVDRDLATICLKCLDKEPQRRYPSALALAEDLERWLRHEPIHARRTNVFTRGRKWVRRNPTLAVLLPVLIALLAVVAVMYSRRETDRPPVGIAVLPFENLGGDQQNASFADGIQDDILTKLAKIADLKVISRTSVMQYRDVRDVRRIGQALRVSHVLEGSVRRSDGRIRLNAQLIDARTDRHLWAEEYDRKLTDVFAIQSELAEKIADQLSVNISATEKKAIRRAPTQDLRAYDLYRRAKELNRFTSPIDPAAFDRLERVAGLLEQAISRDPNFALAYCLLTDVDLTLYWVNGRVDAARRARAEEALHAAQRLSPDSGETHVATALFYHYGNRDLDHALGELDVAARLLPNSPDVFNSSAKIERRLGRWRESLRHFAKADELDPRDPSALLNLVMIHGLLRHYHEAEQLADRGLATFPEAADQFLNDKAEYALAQGDLAGAGAAIGKISSPTGFPELRFGILYYAHNYAEAERFSVSIWQNKDPDFARYMACSSAMAARARGDPEKMHAYFLAAREANEPLLHGEPDPGTLADLAVIDAGLDRKEDAISEGRKAVELRPISSDALEGPEFVLKLATAFALLGEKDLALEQLSLVANVPHGPTYADLKFDPVWDNLRDDPRFTRIMTEAIKPISLP